MCHNTVLYVVCVDRCILQLSIIYVYYIMSVCIYLNIICNYLIE